MKRYVQYGCGFSAPEKWINYDASPTLRFERIPLIGKLYNKNSQRFPINVRYGNIINGLPEKDNSCDGIYCSHILEHLSYNDFQKALQNSYKLLKPGGIFRCVVPDLKYAAESYLQNFDNTESPSSTFLRAILLGKEDRNKNIIATLKDFAGNSKHLWMWDEKSLIYELQRAGFIECRPCKFNDSSDEFFKDVEQAGRFNCAAAIECKK